MGNIFKYIIISIIILLLQVLVLNNLSISGYAVPFVYLWIILRLPESLSRSLVIALGFLIGLFIDIFCNTPGMHALATTIIAYLKDPVTLLYVPREEIKSASISISGLGIAIYVKLLLTIVMIFCISIYVIEAFTFLNPIHLLLKIGTSFVSTFILILALDRMNIIGKSF